MTPAEFNSAIKKWTFDLNASQRQRIPAGSVHKYPNRKGGPIEPKLSTTLTRKYRNARGGQEIERVTLNFATHGAFIAMGVGRGWVRVGGNLQRGRRYSAAEQERLVKRGYTRAEAKQMRNVTEHYALKRRHPVDWFNEPLDRMWPQLADVAQEYYGDIAMNNVADQIDRMKIKYTSNV